MIHQQAEIRMVHHIEAGVIPFGGGNWMARERYSWNEVALRDGGFCPVSAPG